MTSCTLPVLLAAPAVADTPATWRVAVGGQFETQSHGIVDLGWQQGPFSVQLFTDTVDARWTSIGDRGRASVGLRLGAFAAGLWITPWADGAPDLARAHTASYAGLDAEAQRYLPEGVWVGARGFVRPHLFRPLPTTDPAFEVPNTLWTSASAHLGLWRDDGALTARASVGADVTWPGGVAPHLRLEASWRPRWTVAPRLQGWTGVAWNTDDVVATRVGGLTPYHVPFAGAAWAEFWVEDYAVSRLGLDVRTDALTIGVAADVGTWTAPTTTLRSLPQVEGGVGLAALGEWRQDAWFAELSVAWSPTIPRQAGVWPVPVYVRIGRDWAPLP